MKKMMIDNLEMKINGDIALKWWLVMRRLQFKVASLPVHSHRCFSCQKEFSCHEFHESDWFMQLCHVCQH